MSDLRDMRAPDEETIMREPLVAEPVGTELANDIGEKTGLGAFHTFEEEREEPENGKSRIIGTLAVALMVAAVAAYGYESWQPAAPARQVAAQPQRQVAMTPPPVATTPDVTPSVTAPSTGASDVAAPAEAASAPVIPKPAPVRSEAVRSEPVRTHAARAPTSEQAIVAARTNSNAGNEPVPADAITPPAPLVNSAPENVTPPVAQPAVPSAAPAPAAPAPSTTPQQPTDQTDQPATN